MKKKKPIVVLIGGSSGVGTSTASAELSRRLDITHVMETDYIREILRGVIEDKYAPLLHKSSYNAYEILPNYEWLSEHMEFDELVSTGFISHVSLVAPAVRQVIKRAINEVNNIIIEGVHWCGANTPNLDMFKDNADIYKFVLSVNEETHKERFLKRALEKKRGEGHLGYFDEIRITHDYLITRGLENGIQVIDSGKNVGKIVDEILGRVEKK